MTSETRSNSNKTTPAGKNRRVLIIASVVTIAMFGFAYALVPMYNLLCKVAGVNGKTDNFVVELKASEQPDTLL